MKKKPQRRTPKAAPTEMEVQSIFLRAVTELYPRDPSAPGMVTAWLQEEKCFYASVVRYNEAMGQGKQVLFSAKGKTLGEAIINLATTWQDSTANARRLRQISQRRQSYFPDHDWFEGP